MIYRQLLNEGFDRLPAALRAFHSAPGGGHAVGTASVSHQNGWLARLLGFPRAARSQPVRLDVIAKEIEEIWTRTFGTIRSAGQSSEPAPGSGRRPGSASNRISCNRHREGMRFQSSRARLFGIPVPVHVEGSAQGGEHSWNFEVIDFPRRLV